MRSSAAAIGAGSWAPLSHPPLAPPHPQTPPFFSAASHAGGGVGGFSDPVRGVHRGGVGRAAASAHKVTGGRRGAGKGPGGAAPRRWRRRWSTVWLRRGRATCDGLDAVSSVWLLGHARPISGRATPRRGVASGDRVLCFPSRSLHRRCGAAVVGTTVVAGAPSGVYIVDAHAPWPRAAAAAALPPCAAGVVAADVVSAGAGPPVSEPPLPAPCSPSRRRGRWGGRRRQTHLATAVAAAAAAIDSSYGATEAQTDTKGEEVQKGGGAGRGC